MRCAFSDYHFTRSLVNSLTSLFTHFICSSLHILRCANHDLTPQKNNLWIEWLLYKFLLSKYYKSSSLVNFQHPSIVRCLGQVVSYWAWKFFFISLFLRKNMCADNPCANNATCRSSFTDKLYQCLCPAGYKGPRCKQVNKKNPLYCSSEIFNSIIKKHSSRKLTTWTCVLYIIISKQKKKKKNQRENERERHTEESKLTCFFLKSETGV